MDGSAGAHALPETSWWAGWMGPTEGRAHCARGASGKTGSVPRRGALAAVAAAPLLGDQRFHWNSPHTWHPLHEFCQMPVVTEQKLWDRFIPGQGRGNQDPTSCLSCVRAPPKAFPCRALTATAPEDMSASPQPWPGGRPAHTGCYVPMEGRQKS